MKAIIAALLVCTTLAACQKTDGVTPDPAKVTISISSPLAGQIFHSGDTVYINANVTYPSELHGYEVKITDTNSGFIVYDDAEHIHDDHFTISDKWPCTTSLPLGLKLELIANIDHTGDEADKAISFVCTP
jgi:hypothetical protein